MQAEPLTLESVDVTSPDVFGRGGYPHDAWALLRREAPVFRYRRPDCEPFWAVTKYRDLVWVSKQPDLFVNRPVMAMFPRQAGTQGPIGQRRRLELGPVERREGGGFRQLLNMDPPEHRDYRRLAFGWFTPHALRRIEPRIEEICRRILDDVAARGPQGEIDLVPEVAARLPLKVIAEILGVPERDEDMVLQLSNQGIGATDPEFRDEGVSAGQARGEALGALLGYFSELAAEKRARPRDDFASLLATAELNGEPLPLFELLAYYTLIAIAGHETTRNATSGGLLALLENPDQLARLQRERGDPRLIQSAAEEIIRWTSPVIQFCRTAVEDVELRGRKISSGDLLVLFYPSANRDEDVFDEPDRFRLDRSPNPHVAFGIGEHFCLGANLARLEVRIIFRQIAERFERLEPAGEPEYLGSAFVGGVKHLPVRYRLRPTLH